MQINLDVIAGLHREARITDQLPKAFPFPLTVEYYNLQAENYMLTQPVYTYHALVERYASLMKYMTNHPSHVEPDSVALHWLTPDGMYPVFGYNEKSGLTYPLGDLPFEHP
jgi:hypothetical protein